MNSTILEDGEGPDEFSEEIFGKNYGYGIGFTLGILVILAVMTYASYLCVQRRNRNNSNVPNQSSSHGSSMTTITVDNELVFIQQGLDEDILRNYPKLLYSQVKVHNEESDAASGCSICLGDYKDNDMLRLLPDCGHIFHVKCIDSWLKLHPTCPICRNSPLPTPLVEVVPIATR